MKKLKIKHTAGVFDFLKTLTKGSPSLPAEQKEEFEQFKKDILLMYKRLNNAYKIYFQGATLKQKEEYTIEQYRDENGELKERKIKKPAPSRKIDFQGNWKFNLGDGKTSLGQAIHSLYKFVSKITNTKYTLTEGKEQPAKQEEPQKEETPKEQPAQEPTENKKDVRDNV